MQVGLAFPECSICPLDILLHRNVRANPGEFLGAIEAFQEAAVRRSIELDLSLIDVYDPLLKQLEKELVATTKIHDLTSFNLLKSIPGVGKIPALTFLYEIHDIGRFRRVQAFSSYPPDTSQEHAFGGFASWVRFSGLPQVFTVGAGSGMLLAADPHGDQGRRSGPAIHPSRSAPGWRASTGTWPDRVASGP